MSPCQVCNITTPLCPLAAPPPLHSWWMSPYQVCNITTSFSSSRAPTHSHSWLVSPCQVCNIITSLSSSHAPTHSHGWWTPPFQLCNITTTLSLHSLNTQSHTYFENSIKPARHFNVKMGSWDSSVDRAPDSWSKGHGFESRQENFLLQFHICSTIMLLQ